MADVPNLPSALMRCPVATTVMSGCGADPVASMTVTCVNARGRCPDPGCDWPNNTVHVATMSDSDPSAAFITGSVNSVVNSAYAALRFDGTPRTIRGDANRVNGPSVNVV